MVTTVRIDDCADHMNKKPDLFIKNAKQNHSQNLTKDSSDEFKTQ